MKAIQDATKEINTGRQRRNAKRPAAAYKGEYQS
jgi:hypothetical protein